MGFGEACLAVAMLRVPPLALEANQSRCATMRFCALILRQMSSAVEVWVRHIILDVPNG